MNIQLVCRYNFLEAKNANFSFSASSVGSRASEVLSFLTTQRKVRGLKRSKKQVKLHFKTCNFLIVFGVQNVLFLSFKLKTCNKKKICELAPCGAISQDGGRPFYFLWVYRQKYNRFLTSQSALRLSYVIIENN